MVYLSSSPIRRTPVQKFMRIFFGACAVALIIFAFSQIPYDILREERFRLFGEVRTTGMVTETLTDNVPQEPPRFIVRYKYVDQDGQARHATALLPQPLWARYHPGSRIAVLYARPQPDLSRVPHEIEPAFQLWLRNLLH